jgi:hypothetical protein
MILNLGGLGESFACPAFSQLNGGYAVTIPREPPPFGGDGNYCYRLFCVNHIEIPCTLKQIPCGGPFGGDASFAVKIYITRPAVHPSEALGYPAGAAIVSIELWFNGAPAYLVRYPLLHEDMPIDCCNFGPIEKDQMDWFEPGQIIGDIIFWEPMDEPPAFEFSWRLQCGECYYYYYYDDPDQFCNEHAALPATVTLTGGPTGDVTLTLHPSNLYYSGFDGTFLYELTWIAEPNN